MPKKKKPQTLKCFDFTFYFIFICHIEFYFVINDITSILKFLNEIKCLILVGKHALKVIKLQVWICISVFAFTASEKNNYLTAFGNIFVILTNINGSRSLNNRLGWGLRVWLGVSCTQTFHYPTWKAFPINYWSNPRKEPKRRKMNKGCLIFRQQQEQQ